MIRIIDQYEMLPTPLKDERPSLISDCQSCRYTELAYLSSFVACYRPSLRLACLQHYPMYILGDGHQRLGISFFGPQLKSGITKTSPKPEIAVLDESWLVLAPSYTDDHVYLDNFISFDNYTTGFDAIFLFDYSQSTIQIIK